MSINNILSNRSNRDITAAMKKMADGKLNLTVTPAVQIPDKLDVTILNPVHEVSVSNIGDVLKSLSLLGKGIQQLSESVETLRDNNKETSIKFPDFPEMPDMSELAKSIKELRLQIKKIPQQTTVDAPIIEIPKSFRVDNLDELKRGFVAINDNLVKLAGVVRDSQANITLPEQDNVSVISAVERVENAIKGMVFPIPQGSTPSFKNSAGEAVSAIISNGAIPTYSPDVDVTTQTNYTRKYYTNAGAVTDGIVWSPAAGKRWHVTSLYIQVSLDTTLTLEDDLVAGDSVLLKGEFKGGSGVVIPFDRAYPLASEEDAADLLVTTSAGNVYITAVGYEV